MGLLLSTFPLSPVALVSILGFPAVSGSVTLLATVVALNLLARLLLDGRFLRRAPSLLGLLSLPLGMHELGQNLELVVFLLQSL